MSNVITPELVQLIKELGMTGVAIYALYVMNELKKSIDKNSDIVAQLCAKIT